MLRGMHTTKLLFGVAIALLGFCVIISGCKPSNRPPVIGDLNVNPAIVGPGETVVITVASLNDPDGDKVKYIWAAKKGRIDYPAGEDPETSAAIEYTPPSEQGGKPNPDAHLHPNANSDVHSHSNAIPDVHRCSDVTPTARRHPDAYHRGKDHLPWRRRGDLCRVFPSRRHLLWGGRGRGYLDRRCSFRRLSSPTKRPCGQIDRGEVDQLRYTHWCW
jgi:hypothetical protein